MLRTIEKDVKMFTNAINCNTLEISEKNNPYYSNNNEHGYFDQKGWLHRNANVINAQNGKIYNITIDIAKTADGRTVFLLQKEK